MTLPNATGPSTRPLRGWWSAWIILCWAAVFPLHSATFTATLDRSTIALGESATLSLTFTGGTPTRISRLQVPNLAFQSMGESRQFLVNNGQMTSSLTYNYQVTPSQPGDFTIPALQAEVDGQTLNTRPVTLRVSRGGPVGGGLAFLKLIPAKETVYVGEVFAVEVQLFLAARQDSLQMPQIEGDGFIVGKMTQPTQSNTQIGNQMYTVGTFQLSAVAVKSGQLTLGPAQCSLVLHIPVARNRNLLDDFFGGGVQRKPVTLSSEAQSISVLPLPTEGQPPSFNGAVGSFSLKVNASPTNVAAGDPITLKLQVSGEGNLDSLPFPAENGWSEFKLYPPTSKTETSDAIGMTGVKSFERVVIPQNANVKQLPEIQFSFFDPNKKTYRTLTQPPTPITVRASDLRQPQPTVLADAAHAEDPAAQQHDIVHIKPYLGTITPLRPPLLLRPWFWALQSIPVALWLAAWGYRKRKESLDSNPRLRRRLAVAENIRKGLKSLSQLAGTRDSEAFFAAVFRLLQEQLGERLDLPASAITEAVVDERLHGQVPQLLVDQLHHLFQLCNQARYAPDCSPQELMALVPTVESTLRQLRELPEPAK